MEWNGAEMKGAKAGVCVCVCVGSQIGGTSIGCQEGCLSVCVCVCVGGKQSREELRAPAVPFLEWGFVRGSMAI